jgi:crossover junction endodeoxyribonuclease RuvC
MITIGIDPGQTGAIAAIESGALAALHDMPTMARMHGKGQEVNASELSSILMEMRNAQPAVVFLETVSAMPGQGVSSTFHFGESVGVILGVCGALGLPVRRVRPQYWKKRAGIIGKDKDAARTLAIQSHPDFSDMLKRKKDCGRADAILIAEYGA